jgi:hypothetical protein
MRKMRKGLAALLVAVVLVAAGCGKGRLSRADFIAEANADCKLYESRQNQVQFPTVDPISETATHTQRAEWGLALKQILDIGDAEIKELRKLRPPEELENHYEDLLNSWQQAFDTLRDGAVAAKKNDLATLKTKVPAGRAQLAKIAPQAKALGLSDCG